MPPTRRSAVAAGVGIAQGAGVAFGQLLAGSLGGRNVPGAWRLPFVVVAAPALMLAGLVALAEEPRRGAQEPALAGAASSADSEYRERIDLSKARHIFRIRTNQLAFLQGVPGCVPWGVMNTFFADYLATDLHMGVERATGVVAIFGAGCLAGNVAGGLGGQALYNSKPGWMGLLMGWSTLLGTAPLLGCLSLPAGGLSSVLAFLAGALTVGR